MSKRIGIKKVDELVVPLIEQLLEDPEDIVILENLNMINYLVQNKLLSKKRCYNMLELLLPYSFYPNVKIRMAVCTFIHYLSPRKQ